MALRVFESNLKILDIVLPSWIFEKISKAMKEGEAHSKNCWIYQSESVNNGNVVVSVIMCRHYEFVFLNWLGQFSEKHGLYFERGALEVDKADKRAQAGEYLKKAQELLKS